MKSVIYRDYLMESARIWFLFTSFMIQKNEWIKAVQSTFHDVFCLLYTYWDIYHSGITFYSNNFKLVMWKNNWQWNHRDLTNSISEVKMKYAIKITPNLNIETLQQQWKIVVCSLWLDERFFSHVKTVVRGLSLAGTNLCTNVYDMAFSWVCLSMYTV